MKIKNSNFYFSVTLVLILSVCFAVTPSQAGSAVASGSAGTVSATGQVYLHLSDGSMPYVTGSGMVEIDVVGGDFQAVEGELWASYETSLTNNQISVVAAGGSDQVKIVLATGQIGDDPSTSDTFETIYIPSDDTESTPSAKGDDPHAEKRAFREAETGSGSDDPTPGPIGLTSEGQQDTKPEEEPRLSETGDDPHAKKRAFRETEAGSGNPTPNPTLLIRDESQETQPQEEQKPSAKGDDPHAKKRAFREAETRRGDPTPNPTLLIRDESQETQPQEEPRLSETGDDPHAKKRAFRETEAGSGNPTPNPTLLIRDESQETQPQEEPRLSETGDDPHAKKRAFREAETRRGDPTPNPTLLIRDESTGNTAARGAETFGRLW